MNHSVNSNDELCRIQCLASDCIHHTRRQNKPGMTCECKNITMTERCRCKNYYPHNGQVMATKDVKLATHEAYAELDKYCEACEKKTPAPDCDHCPILVASSRIQNLQWQAEEANKQPWKR